MHGLNSPCHSVERFFFAGSVGKLDRSGAAASRRLANPLFLNAGLIFALTIRLSAFSAKAYDGLWRMRRTTATERRGRSVFIIAALSALSWAVLIGLAMLVVSYL